MTNKIYCWIELILLFVLMPVWYGLDQVQVPKIIPLVGLFLYCVFVLFLNKKSPTLKLEADWKPIFIRWGVVVVILFLFLYFATDLALFTDISANRKLLTMILLYPFLSVLPQEIIFREFFLWRYSLIIPNKSMLIIINILLFSFSHVYFNNWLVLLLTLFAGAIFTFTYIKFKSLTVVVLEHILYGEMILLSGLSDYFYKAF